MTRSERRAPVRQVVATALVAFVAALLVGVVGFGDPWLDAAGIAAGIGLGAGIGVYVYHLASR